MLSCRDIVGKADALLAGELDWRTRIRARFHLFLCVDCRRYLRQLRVMLALLKTHQPDDADASTQRTLEKLQQGFKDD